MQSRLCNNKAESLPSSIRTFEQHKLAIKFNTRCLSSWSPFKCLITRKFKRTVYASMHRGPGILSESFNFSETIAKTNASPSGLITAWTIRTNVVDIDALPTIAVVISESSQVQQDAEAMAVLKRFALSAGSSWYPLVTKVGMRMCAIAMYQHIRTMHIVHHKLLPLTARESGSKLSLRVSFLCIN